MSLTKKQLLFAADVAEHYPANCGYDMGHDGNGQGIVDADDVAPGCGCPELELAHWAGSDNSDCGVDDYIWQLGELFNSGSDDGYVSYLALLHRDPKAVAAVLRESAAAMPDEEGA